MREKVCFIVNPNSSNGSTGREWPDIRQRAGELLGPFESSLTTGPEHATQLAREAVRSGFDIVICVGGDGTFNEIINGLMDPDGPPDREVHLGFIPRGTGCDFARSIPVPHDLDKALANILAGSVRCIDLGRLTYLDHEGRSASRYFHNVLSFGLGGEVDDRVNRTTKVFGGFVSFIWATLISILRYDKKLIHLSVDDCFDEDVTAWNVAVANGQYHGGGMWVAPGAAMDDGIFQVTVVGDLHTVDVFWSLPMLYNGKIYEHEKIIKLTGKRIVARASQRVLLDMDGEQPGQLPAVIEMAPSAINIICS